MASNTLSDSDIWGAQVPMSDEQVFGTKPMTGALREPAIAGTGLLKGAVAGTAGLPGNVAELYSRFIGSPFANALNSALGKPQTSQPTSFGLPTYQSVGDFGKRAGVWDRPELAPQGEGERLLYSGAQGVGAALPWAATGGSGGALANMGSAAAGGAGAGVGAQLVQDYYPDNFPGKSAAQLGAGILGGKIGSGFASALDTALRGTPNDVLAAYDRQGLEPRLAGNVVDDPVIQRMQAKGAASPGGEKLAQEWEKSTNEFGRRVEAVAGQISPASSPNPITTLQEAGEFIKDKGQDWLDNFNSTQNDLWKKVDQNIPADTKVDLTPYKGVLDNLGSRSAISQPVQPTLAGRLNAALLRQNPSLTEQGLSTQELNSLEPEWAHGTDFNRLGQDTSTPIQAQVVPPFPGTPQQGLGEGLEGAKTWPEADWSDARYLRTRIGELIRSKTALPTNTSLGDLRQLYSGLSQSMDDAVSYMSPQAQASYAAANAYTKAGHEFLDTTLAPFMKENVLPEQVAARLLTSGNLGATRIDSFKQNIPEAADALAAAKLHQSVQPSSNNIPKYGHYYTPGVSDMAMDISPEAFQSLYGAHPDVQDLAKISEATRKPLMISPMGATSEGGALPTHSTLGAMGNAAAASVMAHELTGGNAVATGLAGIGGMGYGILAPRIEGALAAGVAGTPAYTRYLATRRQAPFSIPSAEIPLGQGQPPIVTPSMSPYLPFLLGK